MGDRDSGCLGCLGLLILGPMVWSIATRLSDESLRAIPYLMGFVVIVAIIRRIWSALPSFVEVSLDTLDTMSGTDFEHYVASLFRTQGYNAVVTKGSGDFGVDVVLRKNGKTIVVQAKCYQGKVGLSAVQQVAAGISHYNATEGWVVTNSYFTKSAEELAASNGIRLIDRNELARAIAQSGVEEIAQSDVQKISEEPSRPEPPESWEELSESWEFVDSSRFMQLDGATTKVSAYKNPFSKLVRIELEQSGGKAQGLQRKSIALSPKESSFFVEKGRLLIKSFKDIALSPKEESFFAEKGRLFIKSLKELMDSNASQLTVATQGRDQLTFGRDRNHKGSLITISISKIENKRDGMGAAIGLDRRDIPEFLRFLDSVEKSL